MWTAGARRHQPSSEQEGTHGGYLASAADLVIGLLFIFIILVVVLAIRDQAQRQQIEEQQRRTLERYEQNEKSMAGFKATIEAQRQQLSGSGDPLVFVTQILGAGLKRQLPNVRIDPSTGVISLPEQVLFARGASDLNQAGVESLAKASQFLAVAMPCFVENQQVGRDCSHNPRRHRIETIFIEGHTDSVPFAPGTRDNFDLALARARAVERAMVANTPLSAFRNRADQPLFSFSAYADLRPIRGTDSADAQNRRVDLRIVLSYQTFDEIMPQLQIPPVGVRPASQ